MKEQEFKSILKKLKEKCYENEHIEDQFDKKILKIIQLHKKELNEKLLYYNEYFIYFL